MKASELRIGNWVIRKQAYKRIYEIYEVAVRTNYSGLLVSVGIESLEPIPLTPEILEGCGFEGWPDKNTFDKNFKSGETIQVRLKQKEIVLFGSDAATEGHGFHIKAEYLHQLQNVYYLAGEELEVKLPSVVHQ